MIDAVVPLDDALAGFERAAAKGAMKIVLDARDA
jgi:hypothetical protein